MKKLLILFCLPLLVFSCKNSERSSEESPEMERTYLANAHLKGQIKSIEETPYTPDENGNISEMDSCCIEITEISDKGYATKISDKTKDGEIDSELAYELTETGLFLSATRTKGGKEIWKRVSTFDAEGKVLHAVDTDSNQKVTYYYNDMVFNEFNQAENGKMYRGDSTYMGEWSFEHIDGFRTGDSWIDSSGLQLVKRTGEVNENGWVSKIVDVQIDSTGSPITLLETYTYDSFDDMGNWTKRTQYVDGNPVKILKRTYTYYK